MKQLFFVLIIFITKICLAQNDSIADCDSYVIENKYRFVESVYVDNKSDSILYTTFIHNVIIDELNSIQFSISEKNQLDTPIFVWIKLANGLYLDLNITGYAKRLVNGKELPTALVKPSKEVQKMIIDKPAELVKIRYGENEYRDLFFELENPFFFSNLLKCVSKKN